MGVTLSILTAVDPVSYYLALSLHDAMLLTNIPQDKVHMLLTRYCCRVSLERGLLEGLLLTERHTVEDALHLLDLSAREGREPAFLNVSCDEGCDEVAMLILMAKGDLLCAGGPGLLEQGELVVVCAVGVDQLVIRAIGRRRGSCHLNSLLFILIMPWIHGVLGFWGFVERSIVLAISPFILHSHWRRGCIRARQAAAKREKEAAWL